MPLQVNDYRVDKIQLYLDTYPDANKTEIAKLLISKEKWETTPESLRKLVAKVKGGIMVKSKKKDFSTPLDDMNFDPEFDIDLPKSFYEPRNRVMLNKTEDNILILNDIHIPYHNLNALKASIKYGSDNHVNTVILNGDIMDVYSLSKFSKQINKPRMSEEIILTRQFFKVLREKFKDASIYWKFGNHEERWEKLILKQIPELADVDTIKDGLGVGTLAKEYGIKIVKDKKVIEAGKNNILHGHEVYSSSGAVNIARSIRTKANDNVTIGHWHIHQEDTAKTIGDKLIGAWVIPCLCGLSPDFNPYNNWSNGFGHQQTDSDGKFVMLNKKIINGLIK